MMRKVLPWPLFIDTAKAPEHLTELIFLSAAEGRDYRNCPGVTVRRSHRAVEKETHVPARICHLCEGLETTALLLGPLIDQITSTRRKAEHMDTYSQNLPKLLH